MTEKLGLLFSVLLERGWEIERLNDFRYDLPEQLQSQLIEARPPRFGPRNRWINYGGFLGLVPGRLFRPGRWPGRSVRAWRRRRGLWYPWWYWLSPEYYEYKRPVAVTYEDGTVRHLVPPYPPGSWGRYAPPPGGFQEQPAMYAGKPVCDHCELKPISSECGSKCGTAYYCGQECADAHFEEHQKHCQ